MPSNPDVFQPLRKTGITGGNFLFLLSSLLLVALLFQYLATQTKANHLNEVTSKLKTVLDTNQKALLLWAQDHVQTASYIANSQEVEDATRNLLAANTSHAFRLEQQQLLRNKLAWLYNVGRYKGFFLIDRNNFNLASSRDENVGKVNLLTNQPDRLALLWSGTALISRPQKSEVLLKNTEGEMVSGYPTMFAAAPVLGANNTVIAVFMLRLDPNEEFYQLLQSARLSKTGESYIFDRYGLMLSNSRFMTQLCAIGLPDNCKYSMLHVTIRDPGHDLTDAHAVTGQNASWPLTRMAESAVRGESGMDLTGYRDYRGVPVVGAWLWIDELSFALAVEQDFSEASYSLDVNLGMLRIMAGVVSVLLVLVTVLAGISNKRLRNSQSRLLGLVDTIYDAVIVIDGKGLIESVNPAVTKLFGYTADDLVGNNVKCLMPEAYASKHDTFLHRYSEQGERKIIGVGREVSGLRKDGSIFPIDLSVSELVFDTDRIYTGIIRDISDRKEVELKMRKERETAQNYLDVVGVMLLVIDKDGKIVLINRMGIYYLASQEQDVIGTNWIDRFVAPEDRASIRNQFQRLMSHDVNSGNAQPSPAVEMNEYSVVSTDGSQRLISWRNIVLTDSQGEVTGILSSGEDITEQRRAEASMKRLNAELEIMALVAKQTDKVVVVADAERKILWVNEAFSHVYGYRLAEVAGQDAVETLLGTNAEHGTLNRIQATMGCGNMVAEEVLSHDKTGHQRWVYLDINSVLNMQGQITEYVALVQDITERRTMVAELQTAKDAAEQANRTKSEFLATMSHEIRTPMNGVVGMIDVLYRTSLDTRQREMINTVKDSAAGLLTIINDILDFSKIEASKLELENTPVELTEIVELVGETLLPISEKSGVELLTYCDPQLPKILGDSSRIRQILFNLVGNALKFSSNMSRPGKVLVSIELAGIHGTTADICISVKDNGIGMSAEVQRQLFSPFTQGESSTTRRFGGTGLGLTICRRLLELMGGEIHMHSREGEGSTFIANFSLPMIKSDVQTPDADLQGVLVIFFAIEQPIASWLLGYLAVTGATVARTNDRSELHKLLNDHGAKGGRRVVVLDDPGHHAVAASIPVDVGINHLASITGIVVFDRFLSGKKIGRVDSTVTVDLNCMRRNTFLRAVSMAAGLETPEKHPQEEFPAAINKYETNARFAGCFVLVAEDNRNNQKVILHQLGVIGCAGEVCDNGQQALELWRSGAYDLLLTDCHMPIMDGYQLTRAVRQEEQPGARIPILAITADALVGTKEKCLDSGMDDFLTKPMQIDELNKKLEQWMPIKGPGQTSFTPLGLDAEHQDRQLTCPQQPARTETPTGAINATALASILGSEDSLILSTFYLDYLEQGRNDIQRVIQACQQGDAATAGRLAHKLKSSARTIGANALAEHCEQLEKLGKSGVTTILDASYQRLPDAFSAVEAWIMDYVARVNAGG